MEISTNFPRQKSHYFLLVTCYVNPRGLVNLRAPTSAPRARRHNVFCFVLFLFIILQPYLSKMNGFRPLGVWAAAGFFLCSATLSLIRLGLPSLPWPSPLVGFSRTRSSRLHPCVFALFSCVPPGYFPGCSPPVPRSPVLRAMSACLVS